MNYVLQNVMALVIMCAGIVTLPLHAAINRSRLKYKSFIVQRTPFTTQRTQTGSPIKASSKPVVSSKSSARVPNKPAKATPEKVHALFQKFVDINSTVSWKCFSTQLINTLSAEPKYTPLVDTLKDLQKEKSAITIGLGMSDYKDLLGPGTKKLLKDYSLPQLRSILERSIALNNKSKQC